MRLPVGRTTMLQRTAAALAMLALAPLAASCGSQSAAETQAINVASWIVKYGMADVKQLQSDYQASAGALGSGQAAQAKSECSKLQADTARMLKQPQPASQPLAKDWAATVSDSNSFAADCLQAVQGSSSAQAAASQAGTQITFDINAVENDIGAILG
ncbi:MAG: hypothetical protein M0Z47_01895 [Actinomycetota bacterium]|nr:hypothetical protein [Actinomycetota bacterium]